MRHLFQSTSILLVSIVGWSSGCAGEQTLVLREPVGPVPRADRSHLLEAHLVVYSAWDRFNTLDSEHPKHTPYRVSSETGAPVARVRNQAGSFRAEPEVLHLAPGKYWVDARATNVGTVRVPVVLQEGQTTIVYLDGTTSPVQNGEEASHWIWQPNGLIVGWKATGDEGVGDGSVHP